MGESVKFKLRVLALGVIIMLWWIGVWGLVETVIYPVIKNHYWRAIAIYSSMIAFIIIVVILSPKPIYGINRDINL